MNRNTFKKRIIFSGGSPLNMESKSKNKKRVSGPNPKIINPGSENSYFILFKHFTI